MMKDPYKQRRFLLIVQVVVLVLGLVLAISDFKYAASVGEGIVELVALPLIIMGLTRLGVRVYQIMSMRLGKKYYNESGVVLVKPRPILGALVGIACAMAVLFAVHSLARAPKLLSYSIIVVLLAAAIYLFVRDVRSVVKGPAAAEGCDHAE